MSSAYVTGALLTVLAVAGSAAAQTCAAPFTRFTDGTDFFGNDLKSMMGTEEECVIACESDPACFALIIKATGTCYLKNMRFMDEEPRILTDTVLAVDLSCLRGGVIAGSEAMVDGEMTSSMVTVMVGDKYVTTKTSWPTADPSKMTASSYYSDAEGVFEEGTDVLPTPEMTTIPGSKPMGATEEPKETMVFTTTIDETVISTYVEQAADGTTSSYSTTSPPQAVPEVPAPEPVNGTVDMVTDGQYLITNTAEVGSEYITVTSDFYSADGVTNNTKAFYSDAEGVAIEGAEMLTVTSVTDPLAMDDAPFSTDTVTLEDGSTVTITSTRTSDGTAITTESLVMEAPMAPDTDGTDEEESAEETEESAEESAEEAAAVPSGTPVLAPAPPPPGSSAATSIAVMGSVLACAVFGAMML